MENKFFEFDDDIEVDFDEDIEIKTKKSKKSRKPKQEKIKTKDLFDHLKAITHEEYDSEYFDNLSEGDKKTFNVYMINRFLSMNQNWVSLVNDFQQRTQFMSGREVYKYYASIIPKEKIFLKYVKESGEKYNKDLTNLMKHHYEISKKEATEYLDILYVIPGGMKIVTELCSMYGHDDKEIKKLIKV